MTDYRVKWSVTEIVNGAGHHDDGVRDGDRCTLASGDVVKAAGSAEELRTALTDELERVFPHHALGPTYDLDRVYEITITEQ